MRSIIVFLEQNKALLSFGVALTFFSCFGQTFLISLYIPEIEKAFQLTNTELSSLYAGATMASAFTLPWVGRMVDYWPLKRFSIMIVCGYAIACLWLSFAIFPLMVLVGFFGLRLFGQGMMGHISVSTMARHFELDRGKAISVATLGHPLGEAIMPLLVSFAIAAYGWRASLQLSGLSLIMVLLPLVMWFLYQQPQELLYPNNSKEGKSSTAGNPMKIMRRRAFWTIAPSLFLLGFMNTAIFFFQLKLGNSRGWDPAWVAGSLSIYAAANAISMMTSGPLVDRVSAFRLFPYMLVPFAMGVFILALWHDPLSYPLSLAFIGIANGGGSTIVNALYAEIFGTGQIGSVRSLFATLMVFSTAFGPVTFGILLDAGWSYQHIFLLFGFALLLAVVWSFRIKRVH